MQNLKIKIAIVALSLFMIGSLYACSSSHKKSEENIETPIDTINQKGNLVKGKLIIGHEVRLFAHTEDHTEYWIVDTSGKLQEEYEKVVGPDTSPYTPVYAELKIIDLGKSDEGFAADYASVYKVVEIIKIEPLELH